MIRYPEADTGVTPSEYNRLLVLKAFWKKACKNPNLRNEAHEAAREAWRDLRPALIDEVRREITNELRQKAMDIDQKIHDEKLRLAMRASLETQQADRKAIEAPPAMEVQKAAIEPPPATEVQKANEKLATEAQNADDKLVSVAAALQLADVFSNWARDRFAPPDDKCKVGLSNVDRKMAEEAATKEVLLVTFTTVKGLFSKDNWVFIGQKQYGELDYGQSFGGHWNLCFYLAACKGNGEAALALKKRLSPMANAISKRLGTGVDFSAPSTLADTEVFMSFVLNEGRPICVANRAANTIVRYANTSSTGDTLYLHLRDGHFTRLF